MALRRKLLDMLNDKNEPLPKRLKLADNALKYQLLPLQNKEGSLLRWIENVLEADTLDVWSTLCDWLSSSYINDLTRNDVTSGDLHSLNNLLLKRFSTFATLDTEIQKLIVKSTLSVLANRVFQQFYKYNLKGYCAIISSLIESVDEECFESIICQDCIYHKYIIQDEKFHDVFLKRYHFWLHSLVSSASKYSTKPCVYQDVVKVIQRCLFLKQFKLFESYLNKIFDKDTSIDANSLTLPNSIINILYANYNKDKFSKHFYKTIFDAFVMSFKDAPLLVYKYFIVLIHSLGFKVKQKFGMAIKSAKPDKLDIVKSIVIVTELFATLSAYQLDLEVKVNEISFKTFLTDLIQSLLDTTKRCDINLLRLLNSASDINPLLLESLIRPIGTYAVLYNEPEQTDVQSEYEKLSVNLLNTFAKLHRVQKFIALLLNILRDALFAKAASKIELDKKNVDDETSDVIGFIGAIVVARNEPALTTNVRLILPAKFLKCFGEHMQCVTSAQISSLWITLMHHLELCVGQDLRNAARVVDADKILLVEIVSVLIAVMMENVRIAEHTITVSSVQKFVKGLKDLGKILGMFGTALMNMEHNQNLMYSLLHLSYLWGELVSTLMFYRLEATDKFERKIDTNYSACNITYLHSYLTSEQWSLIMQRITNFGEKPCKQLMQKLCVQRLKSMVLFEESVSDEISKAILKGIASHFDETWEQLIEDPFCVKILLPQLENAQIQKLNEYYLKTTDSDTCEKGKFESVKDSKVFSLSVLHKCLSRIQGLYRGKKNSMNSSDVNCFAFNGISAMDLDDFLKENLEKHLEELFDLLSDDFSLGGVKMNTKLNLTTLMKYLVVIQSLPVTFLSDDVQVYLFWFIMALRITIETMKPADVSIACKCEDILIGLLSSCVKLGIIGTLKLSKITWIIHTCTAKSNEIFSLFLNKCIKHEENVAELKSGVTFVCENIQSDTSVLKYGLTYLSVIIKNKKNKFSAENKKELVKYYSRICKSMFGILTNEDNLNDGLMVEAYAYTLNKYLNKDKQNRLLQITKCLEKYICLAKDNLCSGTHVKGSLALFEVVLRNKSKIGNVSEDVTEQIWEACKSPERFSNDEKDYSKLVVVLFEQMSYEQFTVVVADMLRNTVESLNNKSEHNVICNIAVWKYILSSNFNPKKTTCWNENLEILIQKLLLRLKENTNSKLSADIIPFILNIIHTVQHNISSAVLDSCLCCVTIISPKTDASTEQFVSVFSSCVSILEALIKFRKAQILDRLPPFLQQYRLLLTLLCLRNGIASASAKEIQEFANCAHLLEKLTKLLVGCNKSMARIAPYLIADILKEYEKVTLYPNVKIHLNNCLYSLLTLCDQHSVSYLLRVLSTASTEIFKITYEHYKKHYRFTGRI